MKCINCGEEIDNQTKKCDECGYEFGPIIITMPEAGLGSYYGEEESKMPLIIGIVSIIAIIAILLIFNWPKENINKSALSVTKIMYESIDKQDADLFLQCLKPTINDTFSTTYDRVYIKEILSIVDNQFDREYGDGWSKQITYQIIDDTKISVMVFGETIIIEPYKIVGKYYIGDLEEFLPL